MGAERLCKTKEKEGERGGGGEEDMKRPGWQQEGGEEGEVRRGVRRDPLIGERFKDMEMRMETRVWGPSERAGCNMDVLVRHDGAEIDEWMLESGGDSGRSDGGSRVGIITG